MLTEFRRRDRNGKIIYQSQLELNDCEAVISLVTEEYLRSKFCLAEMGAAWAMSKHYFPITTMPIERLKSTPLSGLQLRCLDSNSDMGAVYDELLECGISRRRQTAEFTVHLPWFIQQVSQMSDRAMVLSLYKNAGKEYDREYP